MTDITIFAFDSSAVRTLSRDGAPWFVATDIAKILGCRVAKDMIRMLDEDEKGGHIVPTLGGDPREVETSLIPGARPPSSEERFLHAWQDGETRFPYGPCSGVHLYTAYHLWCRARGEHAQRECNIFLCNVGRLPGWSNERRHRFDNPSYFGKTKQARMVWPANCEPALDRTVSQWLTDCYFAFQRSLAEG